MIQLMLCIVAITFVNIGESKECDTVDTNRFYEVSGNIYSTINRLVSR